MSSSSSSSPSSCPPPVVCSDHALTRAISFSATPALDVRTLLLSAPSHPYSNWWSYGSKDYEDGLFMFARGMDDDDTAAGIDVVRELHEHIERQGGGPDIATNELLATRHIEIFQCGGSREQHEYVLMFVARHGGRDIIKSTFGMEWEEGEKPNIKKKFVYQRLNNNRD